jgi:hypothetical protein
MEGIAVVPVSRLISDFLGLGMGLFENIVGAECGG